MVKRFSCFSDQISEWGRNVIFVIKKSDFVDAKQGGLRILLVISTMGMATAANAVTYDATNADSDIWHGGNSNHSLWLPKLLAAGAGWQINPHNSSGIFEYSNGKKIKFFR